MEYEVRESAAAAEAAWATQMPGGRLVKTRVVAGQTGGAYSLFEVEVDPGGGEDPHVQHREDECLYVVEGRFGFVVEGVGTEAGPGTHLYLPKGALHSYRNLGAGKGRLLALHTPGGSYERFLREAGRPVAAARNGGGPSSLAARRADALAEVAARHGIEMCETS